MRIEVFGVVRLAKYRRVRFVVPLLLLGGLLITLMAMGEEVESATIDVGPGGDYSTVQAAIDNAVNGDTIRVANGTYGERIVVDVQIELFGNSSGSVVIDGEGLGDVVTVDASRVTISNLTIKGTKTGEDYAGIHVISGTKVNIFDVNMDNVSGSAIIIEKGCDDATIANCVLSRSSYNGIHAKGPLSGIMAVGNNCSHNKYNGIFFDHGCNHSSILRNECYYNYRSGIRIEGHCDNDTVVENECNLNSGGGLLLASYTSGHRIERNQCNLNNYGIYIIGDQWGTFDENQCNENNNHGLLIRSSHNETVNNIEAKSNDANGIQLSDCQDVIVNGSQIQDNGKYGIILDYSCERVDVMDNSILDQTDRGVYCYDGSEHINISQNVISGNSIGIELLGSNSTVSNNSITDNVEGVIIGRTWNTWTYRYNLIADNTINDNDERGLLVNSEFNRVVGNTFKRNRYGVRFTMGNNTAIDNEFHAHLTTALYCMDTASRPDHVPYMTIRDCTFLNNLGSCIVLSSSWDSEITSNVFRGNNGTAIALWRCWDCSITDNGITNNNASTVSIGSNSKRIRIEDNTLHGISLYTNTAFCTVRNNVWTSQAGGGISLSTYCDNNTIENNTITPLRNAGITFGWRSTHNYIANNTVRNSTEGIFLNDQSDYNTILDNVISGGNYGFWIQYSHYNVIKGNHVTGVNTSLWMNGCTNHLIYNNFLSGKKTFTGNAPATNVFNVTKRKETNICGMPYVGGNYWSDYTGVDNDGDGIGDTKVPHGPGDYLPLKRESIKPVINDETDGKPTTGDPFTIQAGVTDNMGLFSVRVHVWYGTGERANISMENIHGDNWTVTIQVPLDQSEDLHYIILAVDRSENWNSTSIASLRVIDDELPILIGDRSPLNATTGDPFEFIIELDDNIELTGAWIIYRYGVGPEVNLSLIQLVGFEWRNTIQIEHTTSSLHYLIGFADRSGNSNNTTGRNVSIIDNDGPWFVDDRTVRQVGTAGTLGFEVEAMDNIGISSMTVEYWNPTGTHAFRSMDEGAGYVWSFAIEVPEDSTAEIRYRFHAIDEAGNNVSTDDRLVHVVDTLPPYIVEDLTEEFARAGSSHSFVVVVGDNIGVESVIVAFWYQDAEVINLTLTTISEDKWGVDVTIELTTNPVSYRFTVMDAAGLTTRTPIRTIEVHEDIAPWFENDRTPGRASTGNSLRFSISVRDNIGVDEVIVVYRLDKGHEQNAAMFSVGPDRWELVITIPSEVIGILSYQFLARDPSGNQNSTSVREIPIADDDAPSISTPTMPDTCEAGTTLTISFDVTDNVEVYLVWIIMEGPDGGLVNLSLGPEDGTGYSADFDLMAIGGYSWIIWAVDTYGNIVHSGDITTQTVDRTPPVISQVKCEPDSQKVNASIVFSTKVLDLYGLEGVFLVIEGPDGYAGNVSMTVQEDGLWTREASFDLPGKFQFHIEAIDLNGNWMISPASMVEITEDTIEPPPPPPPPNGDGNGGSSSDGGSDVLWYLVVISIVGALVSVSLVFNKMRKGRSGNT